MSPSTNYVLDGIRHVSIYRVKVICDELDESAPVGSRSQQTSEDESSDSDDLVTCSSLGAREGKLSVAFWQRLTKLHREMDEHLEALWSLRNFGLVVLMDVALRGGHVSEY